MKPLRDLWIRIPGMLIITTVVTFTIKLALITILNNPWWKVWGTYLVFTALAWEINRQALIYVRRRNPGINNTRTRIIWLFLGVTFSSFILSFAWDYIFDVTGFWGYDMPVEDYMFDFGVMWIITSMIGSLYEAAYYITEWKDTVLESEDLKKINLQNQLDSLKNQVKPHFLFNSLNSLIALIDEDKTRAKKFVEELSKVYRYLLQSNEAEVSSLAKELAFVRAYYYLLKTRYEEGLNLEIDVNAEAEKLLLPSLALQILLENAVKHNTLDASRPLQIKIIARDHQLEVSNNLQKKTQFVPSNKVGLANIQSKYKLLNQPDIDVRETSGEFKVTLPLISV
jgi:sensor histidine kinase YesM